MKKKRTRLDRINSLKKRLYPDKLLIGNKVWVPEYGCEGTIVGLTEENVVVSLTCQIKHNERFTSFPKPT
jgi:hypothetical protein